MSYVKCRDISFVNNKLYFFVRSNNYDKPYERYTCEVFNQTYLQYGSLELLKELLNVIINKREIQLSSKSMFNFIIYQYKSWLYRNENEDIYNLMLKNDKSRYGTLCLSLLLKYFFYFWSNAKDLNNNRMYEDNHIFYVEEYERCKVLQDGSYVAELKRELLRQGIVCNVERNGVVEKKKDDRNETHKGLLKFFMECKNKYEHSC